MKLIRNIRTRKSAFFIIFLIAILQGTIVTISALQPASVLIPSQGTIHYPFVGNPWDVRSFVGFPYDYLFSKIGTTAWNSYEVLLDELISRFGDPKAGGAVNTLDVRLYWTIMGSRVSGASATNPKVWEGASDGENSFANVAKAIDEIHARGFKVLLGFIRDWDDSGTITAANCAGFLQNYKNIVAQVAQFAEAHDVEYFHMDWEMVLENEKFQDGSLNALWKDVVQAARAVYSGLLATETNYWPSDHWWGEAGSSKPWVDQSKTWENTWWRDLDYIAISTYPILVPQDANRERDSGEAANWDPTVSRLVNAWYDNPEEGFSYFDAFQDLSNHYGKKVLINAGYPSCDGAAMRPWQAYTDRLDWQEQADCWEAFFTVWSQADFALGADLEHFTEPWPPIQPDEGWQYQYNNNFGGKPAEAVIKAGFLAVA